MAEVDSAMVKTLSIRHDFNGRLSASACQKEPSADWSSRLLDLSMIYEGGSRSQAASIGGVGLQSIRIVSQDVV